MDNKQETQETVVDTEILSTQNHATKYGAQLAVVERDFAMLFDNSDMKKHLATLKRKYSGLKIESLKDVETYEEIKKAISVVRPLRTATDKKRKEINKEAKAFIDTVNDMGKKIQDEIAKIEDNLWVEREKFEAFQKEATEKAEREAKEKLDNRVKELIANGIVFTGVWYGIGQIQVGIQMIQEMSDDDYNDLLSKVKIQNEANIAEIKRKDEEAKEFQRIQDQLRLDNEAKQKELQAQEDALNAKLKAISDAEAELARKAQAQKEREELEAKQAQEKAERELLAEKAKPFEALGFSFNYSTQKWIKKIGDNYEWDFTKEDVLSKGFDFEELISQIELAEKYENDRIAQEEADRQAKIKANAEEAEKRRLELLSETQVFCEWIAKLKAIEPPTLKDEKLLFRVNHIIQSINIEP